MLRTGCRTPLGKEGLREHQATPKGFEPSKQHPEKDRHPVKDRHPEAQKHSLAVQSGTFSHHRYIGCLQ